MDIEQLNKSQIVLLTLLVSFVTSIATGIVTVSLMEQAPPAIAQTVNRVIERTIETVTPSTASGQTAATVVTQEKTIVVKETDLMSQAVQKVSPSIVRIYNNSEDNPVLLGIGVVLDTKGSVVTDSDALANSDYTVAMSDGPRVRMFVNGRDEDSGFAFLQPATSTEAAPIWKPAAIASDRSVLGSTVVGIAGKSVVRILPGVVTAMLADTVIDTNISPESILPGSIIINMDGNVIGVSTGAARASSSSGFVSAVLLLPAQ
ncbi:MAG: serine protease family protein [Minisyncoccota bacterium]